MKRLLIVLLIFAGMQFMIPSSSQAIPAFARKYGFNCNMCHVSFAKLNDFGQRYRDDGYQIPGQEGFEKNVFEGPPPLALRTSTGLQAAHSREANSSSLKLMGLDILSAGVFHKNVSYLLIFTPRIDQPGASNHFFLSNENPMQTGTLQSANVVFSNIIKSALNLRLGSFEPAYRTISSRRSYYLAEPYEIYDFASPAGFVFGDNQIGLEATGHFKSGFRYGAGITNGTGVAPDNNKFKDVYMTISQVIGRGEGQNAGQRIDLFSYFGWQPTIFPYGYYIPTGPDIAGTGNKMFRRLGGDVNLNYAPLNLSVLFMQGTDNMKFNLADTTKDYKYTGGFAQLDYNGLINNRLLISAMYNWVQPPSYDNSRKVMAVSGLVRYYLGDWTAVNVALHAEYTHRQTGKTDPLKEDIFTAMVDFAF
jgi:hypothetical protein